MNIEEKDKKVSQKYESEGYSVIIRPEKDQLPSFAAGFDIDLLATKDDEQALVCVKKNIKALRDDPQVSRMAEVINAQPGWRFDLAVAFPTDESDNIPANAIEPTIDRILEGVDFAEQTARNGNASAAFLTAWASLEATMRLAGRSAGLDIESRSTASLLATLYSNGVLDKDDFDYLDKVRKMRNAAVHGLDLPDIDCSVVSHVASIARKLLGEQVVEQHM